MSLIQEALKRKAEEKQESARETSSPDAAPDVSRHEQPAGETLPVTSAPRSQWIAVLFTLLILLLAGGGYYLLKSPPKQTSIGIARPAVQEPAVPIVEPPEPVPPPAPPPGEPQPEPEKARDSEWPALRLTGTAAAGSQRLAVLNGRMLGTGRTMDGVRIIEIRTDEVVVEYNGERRTLRVDDQ